MTETIPSVQLTEPQKVPSLVDGSMRNDSASHGDSFDVRRKSKTPSMALDEQAREQRLEQDGRALSAKLSGGRGGSSKQSSEIESAEGSLADSRKGSQPLIDPISQQILARAGNPSATLQQRLRASVDISAGQASGSEGDLALDSKHSLRGAGRTGTDNSTKDKKKGVSFLSRIIGANKKKPTEDDESEIGDFRPEGMNAELFSQPVDNMGYNPQYLHPPAYIRVKAKFKKERDFNHLFLAQELRTSASPQAPKKSPSSGGSGRSDPVWALEFSQDGRYLAAGGQDKIVRVWSVISSVQERRTHEKEEEAGFGQATEAIHLSAPVFQKRVFRIYTGHTSTILDLSWSKNNFLLSSSMDKTVRLWHISRNECLCSFKHADFVPSIQFHPKDDRFFLAGSLDAKLRLWSIPDKSVAYWNQMPDMITAVAFTPDGKTAFAGTIGGVCQVYDTEGLKPQTQIHVRSNRGKNARGSKITGINAVNYPPENPHGDVKVLISSNDSRIRLYNFRDKSLETKFKGHQNNFSQIRACFSDDARHVISGSEDRKVFIWSTGGPDPVGTQRPVEMYEAHASICTAAVMAPTKTRQHLSNSEDPVYDICNPPPVTLVSMTESNHHGGSDAGIDTSSVQQTPATAEGQFKRPEESPAYIARTAHRGGQIVVTADYNGCLKVFRQDCAYDKRSRSENWETNSNLSRHRVVGSRSGGAAVGRTPSMATRASDRSHKRNSLRDSIGSQLQSDRILSWRQSIGHHHNTGAGSAIDTGSRTSFGSVSKVRGDSPMKNGSQFSIDSSRARGNSVSRSSPRRMPVGVSAGAGGTPGHATPDRASTRRHSSDVGSAGDAADNGSGAAVQPIVVGDNLDRTGKDPASVNDEVGEPGPQIVSQLQPEEGSLKAIHLPVRQSLQKKVSEVSALSSEQSSGDSASSSSAAEDNVTGGGGGGSSKAAGKQLRCRNCRGTEFTARMVKGTGPLLVCGNCGTPRTHS